MAKRQKSSSKNNKGKDMLINVQAIHDVLCETTKIQVHPSSSVYLTAILQFVTAEVIETALKNKKGTSVALTSDDINKAIQADPELKRLFSLI
ncbi:hypothetical protein TNCV_1461781 [Trichonephila clavipes]|nr:hypothetical protein TNCV_1461781 [Trichonephila clavipes]